MPPIKEMHYFDRSHSYPSPSRLAETKVLKRLVQGGYVKRGVRRVFRRLRSRNFELARWWIHYFFRSYTDAWYLKLYKRQTGITGDITLSYSILNREDVARMYNIVPHARLVFMMRNPIERAWSHYRYQERLEGSVSVDDLDAFKAFVDSPDQELRSDYLRTIDLYLEFFDPSQLMLGYYDAIVDQPEALLSEVLKHIGAKNTSEYGNVSQVVNKSRKLEIPVSYREYLESKYADGMSELAARYGGYASKWLSMNDQEKAEQVDGANKLSPVVRL